MTETLTGDLKYFLPVIFFVCACFLSSGAHATDNRGINGAYSSASASAYAGASALSNADAFAGTFGETGSFSGTHDGHKGIRSYGFPQGTDANRDTKSYNIPSAHGGAGRHHGIKDGDHDYNKNNDGCSKCKWENDDYWERDEPEEEEDEVDEDECDDGDDGQYRPGKHDHYGSGGANKGPKRRLQPPGVHKTGPTGVYTDDGIQPGGGVNPSSFSPNIPNIGYSKPTDNFGITSKPSWNTPPIASKPGYGGVTANAFATTSSSWPNWQGGTTPSGFGTSPKPAWSDKHDGVSAGSYGTTPKPGTSWNTAPTGSNAPTSRFPSTPGAPQNTGYGFPSTPPGKLGWNTGRDSTPGSFGVTPKPESSWNTGYGGISTGGFSSPQKPTSWNTGYDDGNFGTTAKPFNTPGQSSNTGSSKPGSNWNSGYGTTPVGTPSCTGSGLSCNQGNIPHGETSDFGKKEQPFGFNKPEYAQPNQLPSNVNSGSYTPGYNEPEYGNSPQNWPSNVKTFQTTKGPYTGVSAPGVQSNAFSGSGKLPTPTTSLSGSGSYPGVTKPSYGSGTNTWQRPGTTSSYAGFPASGFGTTKTPVLSSGSFTGTVQKPGFSLASSSATASAGASAFGTSFGPHSTLKTPLYGTTPTHGGSGYPGVKGYTKPSYGTTPHGTYPDTGSGTWPEKQPGSYNRPPYSQKPEDGSTPSKPLGGGPGIWPSGQPGSYNRPPYNQKPEDGSTPSKSLGSGSGTWPSGPGSYNRPSYGGKPEDGSTPSKPLGGGPETWPSGPGSYNRPSYGGKPEDGSTPSKPLGSGLGTWPSGQPGSYNRPPYSQKPEDGSTPSKPLGGGPGTWPSGPGSYNRPSYGGKPEDGSTPSKPLGGGPGTWPSEQPGSYNRPPYSQKPEDGSTPGKPLGGGPGTWPSEQPGSYNRPPYSQKPEDGSTPSKSLGSGSGTWPSGPGSYNRPSYGGKPEDGSTPSKPLGGGPGTWPSGPGSYNRPSYGGKPEDGSTPSKPLGGGPGTWPSEQSGIKSHPSNYPGAGSGTWPGKQPGHESGCQSCGEVTSSHGGNSNCGSYNCGGCSGKDNTPAIHGCNQAVGGVNKTYYPAGTGDGNVPSIAEAYRPGSTPESLEKWNPQNPFLYGAGRPQSDVSHPWSETTSKPLGQGNPFLDFNSNSPKPAYSSASATDRNVIPYGEEDTKPIGQGNIFLDGGTRGDIGINPNEVPFGGKKPEGNVFLGFPGSVNSSPGSSSYGRPDGSSVPGTSGSGSNLPNPTQCKLGIFGCGTSGSGSYGNNPQSVGTSSGVPGIVGSVGNPGSGSSGHFDAGYPGSVGGNLAGSGQAGAFAGAFSSAQASSFANTGLGNEGRSGNWPSAGAQNQNRPNAWASSGASAFASSSSGSWSGNHPINVKG